LKLGLKRRELLNKESEPSPLSYRKKIPIKPVLTRGRARTSLSVSDREHMAVAFQEGMTDI